MKIGIFDSGVGGRSFVGPVQKKFPNAEIIYKEDKDNIPYGDKSPEQLLALTLPIFKQFQNEGCDAVLVACNTVTTTIINDLRNEIEVPLVGVEPMIKSASLLTESKNIAVCATPSTLKSTRYQWLKQQYAQSVNVFEPDCSNWAYMIENNMQNELQLKNMIDTLRLNKTDVIVLGCTHYHWIEDELRELANPDIQVIQPIEPVLNQLNRVLTGTELPE
jgi:glutamate racemase